MRLFPRSLRASHFRTSLSAFPGAVPRMLPLLAQLVPLRCDLGLAFSTTWGLLKTKFSLAPEEATRAEEG